MPYESIAGIHNRYSIPCRIFPREDQSEAAALGSVAQMFFADFEL
jgi:hypothetical protein